MKSVIMIRVRQLQMIQTGNWRKVYLNVQGWNANCMEKGWKQGWKQGGSGVEAGWKQGIEGGSVQNLP